ncbi:MAG: carbohydrate ABC transporter permease [Eubacteriales bacterium]|jgi:putative aldouronate transport system permease protein
MKHRSLSNRFELMDAILLVVLTIWMLIIAVPFINVIVVSFTTQKEYLETPLLLFPKSPTLDSYRALIEDGRIWGGYKTTLTIVGLGVPLNLFLTTSMAYGLSRRTFPGKKILFTLILFTMIFNGGIIPLYLVMKQLNLTNKIWSVVFGYGINTFYMIIMLNYFRTLPESLMESARLDGAGEWTILFRIVLPLSAPIIATITLFYSVDRWNEWFNAMIFIRDKTMAPLQLVLRSIVMDAAIVDSASSVVDVGETSFTNGIKMAAVLATMLPIMCVFPFLQKHFAKGVMIGAIKA